MRSLEIEREPMRVAVSRPAKGIELVRFVTDGRLFTSVKDRHATLHNVHGSSEWWARRRLWRGEPGVIQLKLPGDVHREVSRDGPARFDVLLFDDARVEEARLALGARRGDPKTLALRSASREALPIARLHARLVHDARDPLAVESAVSEAMCALTTITSGVDALPAPKRGAFQVPVRRALELIDERFTSALTLDEIADHAGLDKFHLVRAFRDEIGLPPYAYVTHRRVMRAQALLLAGIPPSRVASEVGLYDQSQLNRHFRKILGVPPGRFAIAAR